MTGCLAPLSSVHTRRPYQFEDAVFASIPAARYFPHRWGKILFSAYLAIDRGHV